MANRMHRLSHYRIAPVHRHGPSVLGRAMLAVGSLAHLCLVLLSLAVTAPIFTAPAMAQQTFCQPAGSTNCGACNVNNGSVACMTIDPATGKQLTTFTDLNTGDQSVLAVQRPDSTTHACATGFTAQADGTCSSLSQTQGQAVVGSSANVETPNLGCTSTNGATTCSGCQISNGMYKCTGTDPKTGAQFTSQTDLTTGATSTQREVSATAGVCPSGYLNAQGTCVFTNHSQLSPLLQSATAPPTPPKAVTTPVTNPTPTTPTKPVTTPTTPVATPTTPATTPVKTTTPVTTPTKPTLTPAQEKARARAEEQKKKIATDPQTAAAALKRDQYREKKAEATHNTKAEARIQAREKIEKNTLAPKQLRTQTRPVKQAAAVRSTVKTKATPTRKRCTTGKCAS